MRRFMSQFPRECQRSALVGHGVANTRLLAEGCFMLGRAIMSQREIPTIAITALVFGLDPLTPTGVAVGVL